MSSKTVTIQIKNGETYRVPSGEDVFHTLHGVHVFIPSLCGGKGVCGKCKVRVLSGASTEPNEKEKKKLSNEERAEGWRLSCQTLVEKNMVIELPEEIRDIRIFTAEVTELEMVSDNIRRARLKLISPSKISFLPGAFILLDIPPCPGAPRGTARSYSIASPPSSTNAFDINVKLLPSGISSGYIHNTLKCGDQVSFTGPYSGYPYCKETNPLICVAGGSGMSPILSLLRHLTDTGSEREIQYFFGSKTRGELPYSDELRKLEEKLPNFTFTPVVETIEPEDVGHLEHGLVTDAISRHVIDASTSSAYLCGAPGMIDACYTVLDERGLNNDRVFFDKFA